jgi:hypothetical protein
MFALTLSFLNIHRNAQSATHLLSQSLTRTLSTRHLLPTHQRVRIGSSPSERYRVVSAPTGGPSCKLPVSRHVWNNGAILTVRDPFISNLQSHAADPHNHTPSPPPLRRYLLLLLLLGYRSIVLSSSGTISTTSGGVTIFQRALNSLSIFVPHLNYKFASPLPCNLHSPHTQRPGHATHCTPTGRSHELARAHTRGKLTRTHHRL